jgi:RNase adaptor protein for sRNA GlmZ degradation
MAHTALRGGFALLVAIVIASPAWAQLGVVSQWLQHVPQPSALVLFLVAVAGVLVGRYASRKRRDP